MQFGVCGGPDIAAIAKDCGYDFVETSVGGLLKPQEDEAAFQAALAPYREVGLPVPVVNCFIPGTLPITGPTTDLKALGDYVNTTCRRAAEAGVEVIVFGSGGARRIPEGVDASTANDRLVTFGALAAEIAARNGVTIVVEPLNLKECNVLTTVGESAAYVRQVDHPAFKLLVDAYHWGLDNDSADDIVTNGPLFRHTHIATWPNRVPPGAEPCDFGAFFGSLKKGGYDGRVSIEGRLGEAAETLPAALETMRSYC